MGQVFIDLAAWVIVGVVIPGLMFHSLITRKLTVEVGAADGNYAGRPHRSHHSPDTLIATLNPEITTLYELLKYNAARLPPSQPLFGSREVVRVVEEEKMVTKTVGGVETTEKKVWKYFELSEFSWMTYRQCAQDALHIGAGLRKLGLSAHSKVAIFASTSRDWMLMAHGCFTQSITLSTAYDTLGEEGLTFSVNECEITTLFTQADLLPMIKKIGDKTPTLTNIIYTGNATKEHISAIKAAHSHLHLYTMDELRRTGIDNPVDPVPPTPEDLCCIMYTSGSTGNPKGVMLSHGNLISAAVSGFKTQHAYLDNNTVYLAYLPLAHVLEFTVEHICILAGASLGYGSVRTLSDGSVRNCKGDIRELRPTIMVGVPAVWETIRKGIVARLAEIPPTQKAVFDLAFHLKWSLMQMGLPTGFLNSLVFHTVQNQTGGRLKLALSGGAPMAPDTQKFISICICPVIQGYGLTETCGTLFIQDMRDVTNLGNVGAPFPCNEIKLVAVTDTAYTPFPQDPKNNPRGEVWARGKSIMKGYYKQPQLTAESMTSDGWFMTGDIGEWHPDGSLSIIDRKKNLVKLNNGEYVALEKLEALYKTSMFSLNLCIHADPLESFVVGIVVVSEKHIREHAVGLKLAGASTADLTELCVTREVVTAVLDDFKRLAKSAGFKPAEIVQAITLTADEWTPSNGYLTAAQKIKRAEVLSKYSADIKKMYKA
ncbi:long-chain fatty acid-CoA ligase [Batrachochytrium dendrobatidis]